ncbi:5' nucleotidase, NT5C type [Paenibacillus sp. HJGM_3]|uniref:5' nucleotidase, NT5C type n=1 Tax=Paenibacillus sp. HJGM_3 TaxID=3379816 RepID=UPI00385D5F30
MTVTKLEACVEANVDVMIDDGPHYAEQFALADRPLILYEQPYNRAVAHDLIYRASNWTDVKNHLDSLAEQFQRRETLRC